MALSQADRISISKKIVNIPNQDKQAEKIQQQLLVQKLAAQDADLANKSLMDPLTTLINLYQQELNQYDGKIRAELTEQMVQDGGRKKLRNMFFPNDNSVSLPNIADGVWKNFQSFSDTVAIGKDYFGTYPTFQGEQQTIGEMNTVIADIELESAVTRSTGQRCVTDTMLMTDTISNDPDMQQYATDLIAEVNIWKTILTEVVNAIPDSVADPDINRQNLNNIAKSDAQNAISIIDNWLALPDFYTAHGQTSCSGFNSIDVNSLPATKFRAQELNALKNEISNRNIFIGTRIFELTSDDYLGDVQQDFNSGDILSTTGFYGRRYRVIEMRLNLLGGTLSQLIGFENGEGAQEQAKKANDNAKQAYLSVMFATPIKAPPVNTGTVHVLDASGFNVGDTVYVMADGQQEIQTEILNIQGSILFLDKNIPEKYRMQWLARVYKVI